MTAANVAEELSPKLGTTPVVMVYLNINPKDQSFVKIPAWAERVNDFKRETAPVVGKQLTGRKLFECQQTRTSYIIHDLDAQNYIPLRLLVIDRANGSTVRMTLVCVHKDHMKAVDKRMQPGHEAEVRTLLSKNHYDQRVFRNQNNFIIECGNPVSASRMQPFAVLRVVNDEFTIVPNISVV